MAGETLFWKNVYGCRWRAGPYKFSSFFLSLSFYRPTKRRSIRLELLRIGLICLFTFPWVCKILRSSSSSTRSEDSFIIIWLKLVAMRSYGLVKWMRTVTRSIRCYYKNLARSSYLVINLSALVFILWSRRFFLRQLLYRWGMNDTKFLYSCTGFSSLTYWPTLNTFLSCSDLRK